ncbi:MAG: 3-dehydroquinate synthase [bacterium]
MTDSRGRARARTLRVAFPREREVCDVVVGAGVLSQLTRHLERMGSPGRAAIVSSRRVFRLYGVALEAALRRAGYEPARVFLPDGESAKSIESAMSLCRAFVSGGLERDSTVFVLGGGVLCDVGGFAAATFMRGVRTVLVPTTLLAQVDAAIGGKTAINLPQGKNLVGVFHQPRLVLCDVATLATLPARQLRSGIAEVVKVGAALDSVLFSRLERDAESMLSGEPRRLVEIVARAARVKARIVAADEFDRSGRRAILNYGHTVGHAIEAANGYRGVLHGEAVAIGMSAACRLGVALGVTPAASSRRQIALLERFGLPTALPRGLALASIIDYIRRDKKARGGEIPFVLTHSVGSASVTGRVSVRLLSRVLVEMGAGVRRGSR